MTPARSTICAAALAVLLGVAAVAPPARAAGASVVSLAGSADGDFADGLGTVARFNRPAGVALAGGALYVADEYNNRIRRVTLDGYVSTVAGAAEGSARDATGADARFNHPAGIAAGPDGDLYVADFDNGLVRRVTPGGVVTTVPGRDSGRFFARPLGVAVGRDGTVYVAERDANWVSAVSRVGAVRIIARDIVEPHGVAVDGAGNLYVTEFGRQRVIKVLPSGRRYVLAGMGNYGVADGPPGVATLGRPAGIALDARGYVYVADQETRRIRRIAPNGEIETIAGSDEGFLDGPALTARFDGPIGVAPDGGGTVYVGDSFNERIRKIAGVVPGRQTPGAAVPGRLADLARRGLRARCWANEPASCTWTAAVSRRDARRLRVRGTTLAARTFRLTYPHATTIHVSIPRGLRARLRRAGRLRVTVSGTVTSGGVRRAVAPAQRVTLR